MTFLKFSVVFYIVIQAILAFWLVVAYDVLEDRCTSSLQSFRLYSFKMVESFEKVLDSLSVSFTTALQILKPFREISGSI